MVFHYQSLVSYCRPHWSCASRYLYQIQAAAVLQSHLLFPHPRRLSVSSLGTVQLQQLAKQPSHSSLLDRLVYLDCCMLLLLPLLQKMVALAEVTCRQQQAQLFCKAMICVYSGLPLYVECIHQWSWRSKTTPPSWKVPRVMLLASSSLLSSVNM